MTTRNLVKPNRYQDSVTLMQVATQVRAIAGIADAALMMGTAPNREILREAGLLTPEGASAGPNDLIVAIQGSTQALTMAEEQIETLLRGAGPDGMLSSAEQARIALHTLAAGLQALPEANLVLLSTPGLYAAAEAHKALLAGRHVMIFSDNVPLADEVALKNLARERGLLLMGPDCGTAILGGVPLGFANVVRRGSIGVVGASGTGMQEVTTLIDRYGQGVSHAIGTGSHDLSAPVGGVMTLAGLQALEADPQTNVIVVLSKPPDPDVAERVLREAARGRKPVVIAFLGTDLHRLPVEARDAQHLFAVETLDAAAGRAVELVGGNVPATPIISPAIHAVAERLAPQQRYLRGLFSGGTFCYEAMCLLQPIVGPVYSNIPLDPQYALPNPAQSRQHTCLDLGGDEFTVGRPHPMIDLSVRAERILAEAADPEVAVLLLDVVLGYGAHPDPAGVLAETIRIARTRADAAGRALAFVASICGTAGDPQGLDAQAQKLTDAGVILAPSNAAAARIAGAVVARAATMA